MRKKIILYKDNEIKEIKNLKNLKKELKELFKDRNKCVKFEYMIKKIFSYDEFTLKLLLKSIENPFNRDRIKDILKNKIEEIKVEIYDWFYDYISVWINKKMLDRITYSDFKMFENYTKEKIIENL